MKTKSIFLLSLLMIIIVNTSSAQSLDFSFPFNNKIYYADETTLVTFDNLKAHFENVYNDVIIDHFKLVNKTNIETKKDYVIFIGFNEDESIKVAQCVVPNGSTFSLAGSTCTCSGCNKGCDPEHINDNVWKCTTCKLTATSVACTKTVTATTE